MKNQVVNGQVTIDVAAAADYCHKEHPTHKIKAIKMLRGVTGLGLRDAKEAVDGATLRVKLRQEMGELLDSLQGAAIAANRKGTWNTDAKNRIEELRQEVIRRTIGGQS